MRLSDFDFDLPQELIAQRPASPRDSARLLHVADRLADLTVLDLPNLLEAGDLMVFNDTKVIPARLIGRRESGGKVEVTLHKQDEPDLWASFLKPAKKLAEGDPIFFDGDLTARVEKKGQRGETWLRFDRSGEALFAAFKESGFMPLPPYIHRPQGADSKDEDDYQTIFADKEGAVAAPTAALHFTERLLTALDDRGVKRARVTLHVGAGTFLPVTSEDVTEHKMHSEWGEIPAETAQAVMDAKATGKRVMAVGTTSLRLLEAAATAKDQISAFTGETDLFILPGYDFKIADLLMTNFHLPKSTLFMLVSAFAGYERMKAAYAHAVEERYRFFSYGDSSLLERAS